MASRNWDKARRDDLSRKALAYDKTMRDLSGSYESAYEGIVSVCWCGRTLNHDWPGKDDGAPHPKVVT